MGCVSRSRLIESWEPDPFQDSFFLIRNYLLSCIAKTRYTAWYVQNWVSPPRSKRDLDTQTTYVRPSNSVARGLRSVVQTPSKFGHDPCPGMRRVVTAVKCCVRKARFFSLSGQAVKQNERSQGLVCFPTPQRGKPVCFLFFDPIIRHNAHTWGTFSLGIFLNVL